MTDVSCLHCRFWDPYVEEPDLLSEGECRRYPPSVPVTDEYVRNVPLMAHPMTYGEECCGEWKEGSWAMFLIQGSSGD